LLFALYPKDLWYFRRRDAQDTGRREVPVHGRLRANNSEALLEAALGGLGIALPPSWLTAEAISSGLLVPILEDWDAQMAPGPARAIWGVYPPKKVVPPKVRAFLTFYEQRFGKPPYWERTHPDRIE